MAPFRKPDSSHEETRRPASYACVSRSRDGAGKCLAIGPDGRAQGGNRVPMEGSAIAAEKIFARGNRIDRESPPRGGADGEGGGGDGSPLTCLDVSSENLSPGGELTNPHRPAAHQGLLPPPSQGAGSVWRLARIPCPRGRQGSKDGFTLTADMQLPGTLYR